MTTTTRPNGVSTAYEYDGLSRLTRLKHTTSTSIIDYNYAYNTAQQITQITEPQINPTTTRTFGYDPVDRLTSATMTNQPNETYSFDVIGNRTSSHLEGGTSYSHSTFNRLTSRTTMMPSATVSYTFDNNGNMTSKSDLSGKWYYSCDAENRLTNATKFGGLIPRAGESIVYQYDALGRRVVRQDKKTGRTEFTHDGMDVLQDRLQKGDTTTTTNYVNGLGIDDKLKITTGSTSKYFLTDHLGSTVGLADSSGTVSSDDKVVYDSFGREIFNNGVTSQTYPTRYRYTGRESDETTGLMYYRARFYDPQIGRFISEDPIGFRGGDVNLYGYVKNNPINFIDPRGLDIAVIENGPTEGNPFGHTAVAIEKRGVFSYGNGNYGNGSNIIGGSFEEYLAREVPRRNTIIWVIKTTPEQDAAAEAAARKMNNWSPLTAWWLWWDNCSYRSNSILDAAGIDDLNFTDRQNPGHAGGRAYLSGGNYYLVNKGQLPIIIPGMPSTPIYDFGKFEPPTMPIGDDCYCSKGRYTIM